jgi:hypothetical protein
MLNVWVPVINVHFNNNDTASYKALVDFQTTESPSTELWYSKHYHVFSSTWRNSEL